MSLHNIVKDLDLSLAAGREVDVELPATQRIRELYDRGLAAGYRMEGLLSAGAGDGSAGRTGAQGDGRVTEVSIRDFDQVADAFLEARRRPRGEQGVCQSRHRQLPAAGGVGPAQGARAQRARAGAVHPRVHRGLGGPRLLPGERAPAARAACTWMRAPPTRPARWATPPARQAGLVLCAGKIPYTCDGRTRGGRDNYIMWSQDPVRPGRSRAALCQVAPRARLGRENTAEVVARAFQMARQRAGGAGLPDPSA